MFDGLIEIFKMFVGTFLGAFVGWFFAKDKYKAEVQGVVLDNESKKIDNLEKIIEIQGATIDRQSKLIDNLILEVNKNAEKVKQLEEIINRK